MGYSFEEVFMYLSLAQIAKELSDIINSSHFQNHSKSKIVGFKFLSEKETNLESDFVYVCQTETLKQLMSQPIDLDNSCLIIQGSECEIIEDKLAECEYFFITEQITFFSFINRLEAIFTSYDNWGRRMSKLCASQAPLQEIVDLAYDKINIPISILDVNHNVLAINRNINTDDILYNSMLNGYGYSYSDIIDVSTPKLSELDKYSTLDVINNISHNRIFASSVKVDGRTICYVGFHKHDAQPFPSYDLDMFQIFRAFLEQRLANLTSKDIATHSSLFEQFMTDLIENGTINEKILYRTLSVLNYEQYDTYRLYVITYINPALYTEAKLFELMKVIKNSLSNVKCFHIDKYVGVLSRGDIEFNQGYLQSLLKNYPIKFVISNYFEDICEMRMVWSQMMYVMENWKESEKNVTYYDEYLTEYCISTLENHFPTETLYHPVFAQLNEYDNKNKTEYLITIASYLQNKCSISATAAALYMHRNSLQYRIKKIEELLEFKIATSEERSKMLFSSYFVTQNPKGEDNSNDDSFSNSL